MPIEIENFEFDIFRFPGGEMHVRLTENLPSGYIVNLKADIKTSDDIMTLLLLGDALTRNENSIYNLEIPYVPYARQDRVCNPGEPLSVQVMASLINSLKAKKVTIHDPHSDVVSALIHNVQILPQNDLVERAGILGEKLIICPDAGAEKKIAKLKRPYILCTKERDVLSGEIKRTIVHHHGSLEGQDCLIIDDICDGGRTFIEIAKILRQKNAGKIELYVTHGIFSNGPLVFKDLIDQVYYYEQGEIKCLL